MSKWKNNKVDECIIKDSIKARMAFINTFKGVLRHKDKEHLEKYEKLWDLHDHDYSYYLRQTYHNISKDEFADLVFILGTSHYKKDI